METYANGVRISCATPDTRLPSAAIFSLSVRSRRASSSSSAARLRAVMSCTTAKRSCRPVTWSEDQITGLAWTITLRARVHAAAPPVGAQDAGQIRRAHTILARIEEMYAQYHTVPRNNFVHTSMKPPAVECFLGKEGRIFRWNDEEDSVALAARDRS